MNSLISSFATLFLFSVSLPTQYIHMRLHPIGSAIWSDIVRDIRGLHTVHNTLTDDDFYDSSWLSWLHLLIWVFCVFLWWFCSLGTRLGILLTLRACFVSLKSFSRPSPSSFDTSSTSTKNLNVLFFLLCPRMIDTLKQKMTHIMCLNLNKMSNTSIFLTIFSRWREELNSKNPFQMNEMRIRSREREGGSV